VNAGRRFGGRFGNRVGRDGSNPVTRLARQNQPAGFSRHSANFRSPQVSLSGDRRSSCYRCAKGVPVNKLVGRAVCGVGLADTRCSAVSSAEETMEAPGHFEVMEGYCCYRLSGHGPLAEAAGKVIEAITFARAQRMHNLLIDTTNWTGHQSPGTLERYTWGQAFAEAAGSTLKLAMVVRPEMVDPDNFEVTVARNRGLMGHVFDSEKDALAWLLDPAVDEG
jgi:hypothetical protein